MKRCIAWCLAVLTLLFCCAACSKTESLRQVTINEVTRSVFYAPLYVAASKGYFEAEGMTVEIVTGGGSDKSMTALLAGEADVALMGPETGIYVVNQGQKNHPMIVAQLTKRDGSFLLGREANDAFDWEEVRGKAIIGGRPGGMPYMTLLYVLRQHGLEPGKDVEVISNIQFNLIGGAFEGGTGDYVALFEPVASQFAAQGKGHILANMGWRAARCPIPPSWCGPKPSKRTQSLLPPSCGQSTKPRSGCRRLRMKRLPKPCSPTSRIRISLPLRPWPRATVLRTAGRQIPS